MCLFPRVRSCNLSYVFNRSGRGKIMVRLLTSQLVVSDVMTGLFPRFEPRLTPTVQLQTALTDGAEECMKNHCDHRLLRN